MYIDIQRKIVLESLESVKHKNLCLIYYNRFVKINRN